MFTPTRGAPYLVVFGGDQSGGIGGDIRFREQNASTGLRRLHVLGLDLAWSDEDRGELGEGDDGYDAMSMSMSRSANLEESSCQPSLTLHSEIDPVGLQ